MNPADSPPPWLSARGLAAWTDGRAVEALIPQRPPLLLVHRVLGVRKIPTPAVAALFVVDPAEPVLQGHFPKKPIWPGTYTIEGLAQTCALAGRLFLGKDAPGGSAMVVAVKIKLTSVVEPPAELVYFVEHVHMTGDLHRFETEASVKGRLVASGTLDLIVQEG